jgi:hypothetical protein
MMMHHHQTYWIEGINLRCISSQNPLDEDFVQKVIGQWGTFNPTILF